MQTLWRPSSPSAEAAGTGSAAAPADNTMPSTGHHGGGEHYSSSAKSPYSPRAAGRGGGGGSERYSSPPPPSSKTPRGGAGGSPNKLPRSAPWPWLVESKWGVYAAVSLLLFLAVAFAMTTSSASYDISASTFFSFLPAGQRGGDFAEAQVVQVRQQQQTTTTPAATPPPPPPGAGLPRLAYLVSGSKGDLDRLWRALHALYHPRNQYVVHLDREAPVAERLELAARVANTSVFRRAGNVHVIRRANMVTYRGPTMVANTLHACAVLLRRGGAWDWFINLSASDYPLMTQDDILHVFSTLPRNVNFVEHTGYLGWKESERAKPLIVDPGLYRSTKQDIWWAMPKRELPSAFKLFTGSAWVGLSRDFVEFCVWGWDNLPRTLLMYYANFVSSPEGYFHTVLCNAPRFVPTVANHDLHHIQWDVPPRQHPHALALADMPTMIASGAPFARKFARDDPVLDAIDAELLRRPSPAAGNGTNDITFVPGGWCGADDACREVDNDWVLRPGPGAQRLQGLMDRIVRSEAFANSQCK